MVPALSENKFILLRNRKQDFYSRSNKLLKQAYLFELGIGHSVQDTEISAIVVIRF